MTRRALLLAAAALSLPSWAHTRNQPAGQVGLVLPPLASPTLPLQASDGAQRKLTELLHGKTTAVQLMFTGCTTSCPAQGALFAAVAALGLPAQGQLLSISVDALGDNPASLKRWLARFNAPTGPWDAAVPPVAEVERLVDWLRGKPSKGAHSGQVFLFDREGRLRYRTADLPEAREVRSLLHQLAAV